MGPKVACEVPQQSFENTVTWSDVDFSKLRCSTEIRIKTYKKEQVDDGKATEKTQKTALTFYS